ncbi:MAG: DUF2281 domain-containing protein [Proteobacteria bacterium]|nr:DUF2281 domain-containing protein [Pseudomonadota bacterium]
MNLAAKIFDELQDMPEPQQAEVLDFLEFLKSKETREKKRSEAHEWCEFSIGQAMRDMDDEPNLYSADDLKEAF